MKTDSNRTELLRQITAAHFMEEDLSLYLNTHPMDKDVLERFNFYVMQCKALKENYEMNYGMLSVHGTCSPYPWQWINEPWPWEYEANFKLEREEK
jgi:spore coat protein JB